MLDRLDEYAMVDLVKRHNVSSKSTMQAILDDIGQAVARIAIRLDDDVLIKGTSESNWLLNAIAPYRYILYVRHHCLFLIN